MQINKETYWHLKIFRLSIYRYTHISDQSQPNLIWAHLTHGSDEFLTFVFVFSSHKPQALSLSHSLLRPPPPPPSLSSFRLPSDGPRAPETIYLSWLLLPVGSGSSHPGLHWIIALLCFTISLYLYFCLFWCIFIPISLSITNYLVWSALFQVTMSDKGRVAWAPLAMPRPAQSSSSFSSL